MEYSDDASERKALELDRRVDARAAELLNHDPELVALYQCNKQWKLGVQEIMVQMVGFVRSDQTALHVQNWISNYKDLSNRIENASPENPDHEGIALDCAEAFEMLGENLKLLAAGIRRQLSEMPPAPVSHPERLRAVEQAGFQAMMENIRHPDFFQQD